MLNKINNFILKKPVLFGGLLFLLLSFLFNIIEILIFKSAHINDIIHIFPTIFVYEPIINILGGFKLNQIYYIPLACIIDFLIGLALSFVLSKFKYTKNHFLISLIITFLIYCFFITIQWLPII